MQFISILSYQKMVFKMFFKEDKYEPKLYMKYVKLT